ncbi:MAG: PilZ domain-containing protein [Candidatus Acidiferrales bacterium]
MNRAKKSPPALDWSAARRAERYSSLRDLSVSYEGHSESIITRLPDVSPRGMFINTAKHFPEGAVLNVRFRLARTGAQVQTRCEVRHCLEGVGIGVEFVDISAEAARAIEYELRPTILPEAQASNPRGSHAGHARTAKRSPNAPKSGGAKHTSRRPKKIVRRRTPPRPRKK